MTPRWRVVMQDWSEHKVGTRPPPMRQLSRHITRELADARVRKLTRGFGPAAALCVTGVLIAVKYIKPREEP